MHMLYKTGMVCLRVAYPHFIFDRIGVRTFRTHTCRLLPEDLVLALNQVLSFFTIPFLPRILSGGPMYSNSTSVSTIDPDKQGGVIIKVFVVRVNNIPPPTLCTPHHEPIVGVIYHLFSKIIVEIRLGLRRPSDTLVCKPEIDHIHCKNRYIEPLRPIFSTQFFSNVNTFLASPILHINFSHAL